MVKPIRPVLMILPTCIQNMELYELTGGGVDTVRERHHKYL